MSDSEDIDPAEHALSMDELMTWLQRKLALPHSDQQRNYATGKSPIDSFVW